MHLFAYFFLLNIKCIKVWNFAFQASEIINDRTDMLKITATQKTLLSKKHAEINHFSNPS